MDANEPVVIHTTNNPAEAEILKNLLEGEGIKCMLDAENEAGLVGISDIRILVHAWDEAKARQVLTSRPRQHEGRPGKQRSD